MASRRKWKTAVGGGRLTDEAAAAPSKGGGVERETRQ